MPRLPMLAALLATLAAPAAAEVTLSFYTGWQTAPHSRVTGEDAGGEFDVLAEWEGRPFSAPPHWGLRYTWWRTERLGLGFEVNHTKVYADSDTRAKGGFDVLEFSDGLNIVTANVMYRWPGQGANGRLTPYVGAGAGVSVPHVEVQRGGGEKTFEYQLTGPAAMWVAGLSYDLTDRWGVFAEYKGTASWNEADLAGGGTLETDIVTNALNFGVSVSF